MPRAAPLALPLGPPLGPPLGDPVGRPDPVGDAIPAAFRHSWSFACSAGSTPALEPGDPPDCEAAGVDPANGDLVVGVVGEADGGVVGAGRELAEPLQPAMRPATARAATPSRAAAANDTVVLFT